MQPGAVWCNHALLGAVGCSLAQFYVQQAVSRVTRDLACWGGECGEEWCIDGGAFGPGVAPCLDLAALAWIWSWPMCWGPRLDQSGTGSHAPASPLSTRITMQCHRAHAHTRQLPRHAAIRRDLARVVHAYTHNRRPASETQTSFAQKHMNWLTWWTGTATPSPAQATLPTGKPFWDA